MKNSTIALFVGIFIIISLASFFTSHENIVLFTGHASSDSSTSFNLTEETSVRVTGSVNFGAGRVYANASNAILDSGEGYYYNYSWINVTSSGTAPSARWAPVVYDKSRDVFIMYGWSDYGGHAQQNYETWQYNYSSNQWTNLSTANHPNAYDGFAIAYDDSTDEIILFGGVNFTNYLNETWKFNSSGDWEQLFPSNSPPASMNSPMVFDSKRNVMVYHTGDTWEYNSSSNNWVKRTLSVKPKSGIYHGMAFDSDRNVTVLFGGCCYYNETWEYNGTDWANVTASVSGAPKTGRYETSMTYDSYRKKVVIAGGSTIAAPGTSKATWEYNATHWTNRANLSSERDGSVVFDSKNNKTFIFYGFYYPYVGEQEFLSGVWLYNVTEIDFNSSASINGTWYFQRGLFNIENDGTVNISVNYTADKNAAQFIGGTSPSFMLKGIVSESDACPDLNTSYAEIPNSTQTPNVFCPVLKYQNDADLFKASVKLVVPGDVVSGSRNATITFSAVKV